MQLAIYLYDHVTALDAVGPYEVLSRLPGVEPVFIADRRGPVRCDTGHLALVADATLEEVAEPDIVLLPGWSGAPQNELLAPGSLHDWLRHADQHSTWTASVCTGSMILASAGLLAGRRATTHWLAIDELTGHGAVATDDRVVFDGKYVTAAGVSAGIDMALTLAARIADEPSAQAIQLGIEYDPLPPFDAGSVSKAPAEIVAAMTAIRDFIVFGGVR